MIVSRIAFGIPTTAQKRKYLQTRPIIYFNLTDSRRQSKRSNQWCFKYNILCKFKETNNIINKSRIILTGYGIKLFYTSDNNDETINKINNNKMKYLNKIACEWNSEFRYPYMEKELIHLIMSIDKNLKKNIQFGNKEYNYYLLRKMMEIYIPEYKDLYYLS